MFRRMGRQDHPGTSAKEVHEMTIVRRPSPFGELISLRSAMDRLFEDSFVGRSFASGFDQTNQLPVDVTRTADTLVVEAALPGIKPEDVDITVEDNTLSIRGDFSDERRTGEGESLVSEIRRGTFARTISLPTGLEPDKATATFEHGVLTLRIPKAESVKPRQIRISPTIEGSSSATRPSGSADAKPIATTGNGSKAEPSMAGQKG
jgi:HSP20 family protein